MVGAGHNGLVAAAYLAQAGLSVLMLERNNETGGATQSKRVFAGVDARLSVYSYLVSLFPAKIANDLGFDLHLVSRKIASYTPSFHQGQLQELMISNESTEVTRDSFLQLTTEADYRGYLKLQEMQTKLAEVLWPTLLEPLVSKAKMKARLGDDAAWDAYIDTPVGEVIESHISNDLLRGVLFTDAKIGVMTWPSDPSMLQNLTYLYHILGRGTGEWAVPVGGMGTVANGLKAIALAAGVTIMTDATVSRVQPETKNATVVFEAEDKSCHVDGRFVLCNVAPAVCDSLLGIGKRADRDIDEGSVVKINMLLKRLPKLRSTRYGAEDAFRGTFHIDEGYEQMTENYHRAKTGQIAERPGGEMYCHTLSDHSILSDGLHAQGWHALTLFGLDMPYSLFEKENDTFRRQARDKYLAGINQYLLEPIEECIAEDANGDMCIETKTPVDLEAEIHLPKGNIFHDALTWPFAEEACEVGQWGVETGHATIFMCGSGARRGGAVSGIPGHNAAMKVLQCLKS